MKIARVIKNILLVLILAISVLVLTPSIVKAEVLVKNTVITPPPGEEEPDITACPPACEGDVLPLSTKIKGTTINNTKENITAIMYILPDQQNAKWSRDSYSDIFKQLHYYNNDKQLLFTGGSIAPGEKAFAIRETSPSDKAVTFNFEILYSPVLPEPQSNWKYAGIVAGLLGMGLIVRRAIVS